MLLSFRCDNFKSFRDGFNFNMRPKKGLSDLKFSLLEECIKSKKISAIATSVIYGPNAAGKSSIINAMSCLKQIINRGNIEDAKEDITQDHVTACMSLIPFRYLKMVKPVMFDVVYTFNENKYRYVISFTVGNFLDKDANRTIEQEKLYINDILIFDRLQDEIKTLSVSSIKKFLNSGYNIEEVDKDRQSMGNNIKHNELLLTTDFNSFCSKYIVGEIKEWFNKHFLVINASNRTRMYPNMTDMLDGKLLIDSQMNDIAKEAGIIGSDFAYATDNEAHRPKLISIIEGKNIYGIDADKIESVGTIRLISIMPAILIALSNGSVLIVDEFDVSLHPMIIMNIISLFHNEDINTKHAQLIFNTHNPIFLNNHLLRRDEIKFVERDKETKSSCLYSLSDFKTNGMSSVRKTSDYMKNYFVSRYGAIEHIDFTDIVKSILSNKGKDE